MATLLSCSGGACNGDGSRQTLFYLANAPDNAALLHPVIYADRIDRLYAVHLWATFAKYVNGYVLYMRVAWSHDRCFILCSLAATEAIFFHAIGVFKLMAFSPQMGGMETSGGARIIY
jgi:hypothetical protein